MTDSPQPPVRKKKVRPYPFPGTLELASVKRELDVIHLTKTGFIAKLKAGIVSVGEYYQAVLDLPVSHNFVNTKVRVWKTYDRAVDPKQHVVDRMAEFHFEALTEDHLQYIVSFLGAIGQK